jgi:hypothetical protein
VLPLAGAGVQIVALADDAPALRRLLDHGSRVCGAGTEGTYRPCSPSFSSSSSSSSSSVAAATRTGVAGAASRPISPPGPGGP